MLRHLARYIKFLTNVKANGSLLTVLKYNLAIFVNPIMRKVFHQYHCVNQFSRRGHSRHHEVFLAYEVKGRRSLFSASGSSYLNNTVKSLQGSNVVMHPNCVLIKAGTHNSCWQTDR